MRGLSPPTDTARCPASTVPPAGGKIYLAALIPNCSAIRCGIGEYGMRYADGRIVSGEYAEYAPRPLNKGDRLDFDGSEWILRDRVDRGGVAVYLLSPSDASDGPAESARRRARRQSP